MIQHRNHRRARHRMPTTTKLLLALALATTACYVAWTIQEPDRKEATNGR